MNNILIIEDEQAIAELEKDYLEMNGFTITVCNDGLSGEETALAGDFDLIILDLMLPEIDGYEVCRHIREVKDIPIIMVSAKKEDLDKIYGLGMGADDYITKPFSVREVMARVKAVLNRSVIHQSGKRVLLTYEDLMVNVAEKTVSVEGKEVLLTKTEFELLWVLLGNRGQVFSRQELLAMVWPQDVVVTDRTVDVSITRLRKKLGKYAANIASRQGFGYYFDTQRQGNEKAE